MAYVPANVTVNNINKKNKFRVYVKDGGGSFDMAQTDIDTLFSYLGTQGFKEVGRCSAYPVFENSYGDAIEDNYGLESGGELTWTATAEQLGIDDDTWTSVMGLHETTVTIVYVAPATGVVRQFKNITIRVYDGANDAGTESIMYDMYKKSSNVTDFSTRNTLIPQTFTGAITSVEIIYGGDTIAATDGTLTAQGSGSSATFTYTLNAGVIDAVTVTAGGSGYTKGDTYITLDADVTGDFVTPPVLKAVVDYE